MVEILNNRVSRISRLSVKSYSKCSSSMKKKAAVCLPFYKKQKAENLGAVQSENIDSFHHRVNHYGWSFIAKSDLPEGSVVINKPAAFYDEY